jgi:hypothetical protein
MSWRRSLITEMEHDGKGVTVLLKHYLKLSARLGGFNVDAQFNDVIDGMMVVDLLRTDARVLQKYMGRDEAETFLARCSKPVPLWRAARSGPRGLPD